MTEDEIVGWHQRLNGHEFEQTPQGSEGNWAKIYDFTEKDNISN